MHIGIDGRYTQDHFSGISRYVVNLSQAVVPPLGEGE